MSSNSAANIAVTLQKLANQATEKSFKYNKEEANTARAWQKTMSDTSHQREVKDLIKAGLNPVLSSGGAGAQSYTTSSASAQAESATNAVGNVYSSEISANAAKSAARVAAEATRAAAAQQAAATRYAATMQYQTQKDSWKWKTDYMKKEKQEQTKYMKSEYQEKLKLPVNNFASLIDKYATRSGLADTALSSKLVKKVVSGFGALVNNPYKAFKSTVSKLSKNSPYNDLNKYGQSKINTALTSFGIKSNKVTRNLLTNAIFKGDTKSWKALKPYMPKKKVYRPTGYTPASSALMHYRIHKR